MSGPVDVLARAVERLRAPHPDHARDAANNEAAIALHEWGAAVAELIEAAKEFSDLYGCLWDVVAPDGAGFLSPESVKKYDDAHGKLMAALASCGGAK